MHALVSFDLRNGQTDGRAGPKSGSSSAWRSQLSPSPSTSYSSEKFRYFDIRNRLIVRYIRDSVHKRNLLPDSESTYTINKSRIVLEHPFPNKFVPKMAPFLVNLKSRDTTRDILEIISLRYISHIYVNTKLRLTGSTSKGRNSISRNRFM